VTRRVAGLQPGYLPWLGFFDQMLSADLFIIADEMPFTKTGWSHRNRVLTANGTAWLRLPIRRGSGRPIDQVEIDPTEPWRRSHLRTLRQAYAASRYAEEEIDRLEATLDPDATQLTDVVVPSLIGLAGRFGITTPVIRSSEAQLERAYVERFPDRPGPTHRIIAFLQEVGGDALLEGEAGVGKTEVAKALAEARAARLIRLQCYEGLDAGQALYEWNYQRQLLAIRAREGQNPDAVEELVFSERYLLKRPLLEAITQSEPPVLLIDEIDRADEAFEAYLLEVLSDFQITVPELGTIRATARPFVVLTSNGTRELSDALRRRCLYAYVDYPGPERERAIVLARLPHVEVELAGQAARFVSALRAENLEKTPGIAETLDWVAALSGLGVRDVTADPETVLATLGCLLKTEPDLRSVTIEVVARLAGKAA